MGLRPVLEVMENRPLHQRSLHIPEHVFDARQKNLGAPDLLGIPCPDPVCLIELFRHKLVKGLLAREKISPRLVEIMQNWVHPGFSVFPGERIDPDDHQARRRLAG